MTKEKENEQSIESENSDESGSGGDEFQPNEFIEPSENDDLSEGPSSENSPGDFIENEGGSEINNNRDQDSPDNQFTAETEDDSDTPELENDSFDENEIAAGPTAKAAGNEFEDKNSAQKKPSSGNANTTVKNEIRKNLSKLAFSVVFMVVVIIGLLTYGNKWSFRLHKETSPPADQPEKTATSAHPVKLNQTKENDPHQKYRTVFREVTALRQALLLKKQEIAALKAHYGKGIVRLENDILKEILEKKIKSYQQALQNKRIELRLRMIQRRLAYIQKLDDPQYWLEQGSEILLFLKRKATFDLQIIDIASGIDMDMHMRHINAAIQKYQLNAENLAIEPDGAEKAPMENIWQRLFARAEANPNLQVELDNWYIQQEVCNGDLSRIGDLSVISLETAKCVSEANGSDLFLNNISTLSPQAAKYLCQWNGKWMCLNGLQILSPAAAQYLFQWEGEWISLNGLSEFPAGLARHLAQWKGKQLELMGLKCNNDKPDQTTLTVMAEWEKGGGKLFLPQSIRELMKQL